MLSSADLQIERALFLAALIIFFGVGFSCTLILFIINSIKQKPKNTPYYVFSFLISGTIVLALAAFYFCMMLLQ